MAKGLSAPTIISLIIAVAIGGLLLYIFWTRGATPFMGVTSEQDCRTTIFKACNKFTGMNFNVFDDTKIKSCIEKYFPEENSDYEECIDGNQDKCSSMCIAFESGTV